VPLCGRAPLEFVSRPAVSAWDFMTLRLYGCDPTTKVSNRKHKYNTKNLIECLQQNGLKQGPRAKVGGGPRDYQDCQDRED
ncbi:MAG TPA: hypothetical protein VN679_03345, partial [Candidatus Acidoferrales bacterium]|nr:hypothetical protein [Candidatus Acidoferrales bacterium]